VKTWLERDLPVLRYLHDNPPEGGFLEADYLDNAEELGLHEEEFARAIATLGDAGYVAWTGGGGEAGRGEYWTGFYVTGEGMQALGEWPVFEALGEPAHFGALLDRLASMAANDDDEHNLEAVSLRVKRLAPDLLRALFVGAAQALARHAL
jgi:hypothetical protein